MKRAVRQTKNHKHLQDRIKICHREPEIQTLRILKANLNNHRVKDNLTPISKKVQVLKNIAKELTKMLEKTLAS
jgi:pantothenate kinase